MLAYGCSADQVEEYLKLGESTARECLAQFVDGVLAQFATEYLCKPILEDIQCLLREGEDRGFPGMLGSIDCMHWVWKNCPAGWKGIWVYPKWSTFINAIAVPQTLKYKLFTTRQASTRKDVELAFSVLQARFAIIRKLALAWSVKLMWKIMMTCIIIHNMIVEDERDTYLNYKDPLEFAQEQPENMPGSSSTRNATTFTVTPG
ncbi:uncharacterized protein LOC110725995 [Chenopodium quinoa]|uniref:uncharacterized protein LOC110725995 n=1 Tax=Chenopodium quinoa TaxID=63459 RepID=UPI000B77D099|nr:uncharacterized protein LOC110725995 [Chenopodium quinoa]